VVAQEVTRPSAPAVVQVAVAVVVLVVVRRARQAKETLEVPESLEAHLTAIGSVVEVVVPGRQLLQLTAQPLLPALVERAPRFHGFQPPCVQASTSASNPQAPHSSPVVVAVEPPYTELVGLVALEVVALVRHIKAPQ
jgi:hypothetical protein